MTYSTAEFSRLTGASLRQLQHWGEQGWLVPERGAGGRPGRSDNRRYRQEQIPLAKLLVGSGKQPVRVWRMLGGRKLLRYAALGRTKLLTADSERDLIRLMAASREGFQVVDTVTGSSS